MASWQVQRVFSYIRNEKGLAKFVQVVEICAELVQSTVDRLSAPQLTSVALQFSATNMLSAHLPDFWAALLSRWRSTLQSCSFQQLADLTWAFHRAGGLDDVRADIIAAISSRLDISGDSCADGQQDRPQAQPVSRELAQEAANVLHRLGRAGILDKDDCTIIPRLMAVVELGLDQVRSSCDIRDGTTQRFAFNY
jgi:hypothetical protein